MITFVKKIKTKEGINSLDTDKIKKEIPAGYEAVNNEPSITYTANHIVVAFTCKVQSKPKPAAKPVAKPAAPARAKSKKA